MNDNTNAVVLLIDDDPQFAQTVERTLAESYTVFSALSPEDVPEEVLDSIHVLLLDIHLKKISGLDYALSFKQMHPNIPIIFITGDSSRELLLKALQIGVSDFIDKPCSDLRLQNTIQRVLNESHLKQELENSKIYFERVRALNALVTTYSHEIRNPLTYIKGYAYAKQPPSKGREGLKTALKQIEAVLEQIEALTEQEIKYEPYATSPTQMLRLPKIK